MKLHKTISAAALAATLVITGCGESIKTSELLGYWHGTEVILANGQVEPIEPAEQDMVQITETQLVSLRIARGSTTELNYTLDGNSIRVQDKEMFVVDSVTANELRLKAGNGVEVEPKFKGAIAILKRIPPEQFEAAKK
jgi:hypothetical protein